MPPIIDVQNISKKYKIGAAQPRYLSLRDSLSATFKGVKNWATFQESANSKANNEFWALKDVNFQVNAGESIGIIGRNGAGKSTLLKILSRITPPTSGHAILRGRLASLLEVGTGFHPELTGRENVYFNGSILGLRKAEIDRKFDEIVDFSGVERFIDTPLKQYSSGMQLRLAFAVAAHLEPEILIIDEVLAVGDAEFQKKCLGKMDEVSRSGRTVIFVSHNMGAIQSFCKRGFLLDHGQLISEGTIDNVINDYLMANTNVSKAVCTFENNDKAIQITKITLTDTYFNPKTHFNLGDKVCLAIEYSVRQPMTGTNMELVLKRNGTVILCSFDIDENEKNLSKTEIGHFKYIVNLPTDILKAGHYSLSLGNGLMGIGLIEILPDVIFFTIEELNIDTTNKGFAENRIGFLYKKIEWQKIK